MESPFKEGRTTFIVCCSYGYGVKLPEELGGGYISNMDSYDYNREYDEEYEEKYNKEWDKHCDEKIVKYLWDNFDLHAGYGFVSVPNRFARYYEYRGEVDDTEDNIIDYGQMIRDAEEEELTELIREIRECEEDIEVIEHPLEKS